MHSLLIWLLFLALPLQRRIALLWGANEYQSVFLYASDVLIALLFLFWLLSKPPAQHKADWQRYRSVLIPALAFIGWLVISSLFSWHPLLGIAKTIKIAEFMWLFYYLLLLNPSQRIIAALAFIISASIQSIIGITQFLVQHSLGLVILGENVLSPALPGVAKLEFAGQKIIRAYGTLPHPNVLAALLVIALFMVFHLVQRRAALRVYVYGALPLLLGALLATFSRVAIIIGLGTLCLWLLMQKEQRATAPAKLFFVCLAVFALLLFPYAKSRIPVSLADQSVSFRLFYVQSAFYMLAAHPLTGVGLSQFTRAQEPLIQRAHMPEFANQPVHNIYLLLIAETGLPGLFLLYWFLYHLFHPLARLPWKKRSLALLFPAMILLLASFDHFFFSFQQGQLLFWTALAFSSSYLANQFLSGA